MKRTINEPRAMLIIAIFIFGMVLGMLMGYGLPLHVLTWTALLFFVIALGLAIIALSLEGRRYSV